MFDNIYENYYLDVKMHLAKLKTYFDTPERTNISIVEAKRKTILNTSCLQSILEGFPHLALILDRNRQIVAYNSKAFKYFIGSNGDGVYGKRLGEALNCIHSREMEAGCGTSMFCRECGAAQAIKRTNETSENSLQECRITVNKNDCEDALDFRVYTTKISLDGEDYILFSVEDIQNEKRRLVLERIFFHDVLNTAAAIRGIAEVLPNLKNEKEFEEFSAMLLQSSDQLIDEIHAQRDLLYAENGILKINLLEVSVNDILSKIEALYKEHELRKNKLFEVNYLPSDIKIKTDSALLVRSIGNLVKNAFEAVKENQKVQLFTQVTDDEISFVVWNDGVIHKTIQLQIFQRSFSTKAKNGRGIGTYSVKLFVEKYLGGKVSFISNPELQTKFIITLYR